MSLLDSLRNLVEGTRDREGRTAVRANAMEHVKIAQAELRKARDARQLEVLEAQYKRRIKGPGKPA